ncbi:hypothetical protein NACSLCCMFF_190053 [Tenacibaculum maritimum]|uniref:hypothetical protein n=1 Tax=Tenacibaculum maritimum TaxID=107401 RepID=UPI0012E5E8D8|nr:hypothetical protein [Tenacibaculum maritimum]CAA0177255.1 hypothetical protein NACSLCCMFF_190053 [Tenacibaculum maritimum]
MNLLQTHLLLAEEEEDLINNPLPTYRHSTTGLHGFWDGANLMGIINTIGGTWSQIEQARNGKPVYVQQANGETKDIAPMLIAKLEQQAQAQQTSVDNLVKVMEMHLKSQQQPPKKDKTLLYVGVGAGVLVLLGGMYVLTKNK